MNKEKLAEEMHNAGLESYVGKAHRLLKKYVEDKIADSSGEVKGFNTHVVWCSKTLRNWKAVMITDLPDQKLYELTYNGDKEQTYIDEYDKVNNVTVDDV